MALEEFDHFFAEAKLSSKERNKLDDEQFGIPSLRKYPLTDEKHVLQAVRFFNKAPEEHKPELARNIVKRAKELDMEWEKWDVLKPYLDKHIKEADEPIPETDDDPAPPVENAQPAKNLSDTPEARKCLYALQSVRYDNSSPNNWILRTPDEVVIDKLANCHDISYYVHSKLDDFAGHIVDKGVLFFIEYDKDNKGGKTHSVCYEVIDGGICVIEVSWDDMKGTFPYNDINEYIEVVRQNWDYGQGYNALWVTEIKNFDKIKPGINLSEYVDIVMENPEIQ